MNIENLDDELYRAIYGLPKVGNYKEIWGRIKKDIQVLREAVQIKKDKFDERDIVKGLTISNAILIDYESVDEVAYNNLINSIYTNEDIARIVMDGASNGGFSFLLISLFNHNLKLSEEQKKFAVNEAMNKIGTTRWNQKEKDFSKKLDENGINDKFECFTGIGNSVNPIGLKSHFMYQNYIYATLDNKQAHGIGTFDIRYYILKNPNWTMEEKQKLVYDFYAEDEIWNDYLESFEWNIINDIDNIDENNECILKMDYIYDYKYEHLVSIFKDKNTIDRLWEEIQFCKLMNEIRPKKYENEFQFCKK